MSSRRGWAAALAACALLLTAGCPGRNAPAPPAPGPGPAPVGVAGQAIRFVPTTAAPATLSEALAITAEDPRLPGLIIESLNKRVNGRLASLPDIERIIRELSPIMREAANQPEVRASLEMLARDRGITLEQAREEWLAHEEADILLESGGDPDVVSVSDAVGVAQWIEETGRRAGLRINLKESNRLTAQIDPLKRKIAWLEWNAAAGKTPEKAAEVRALRAKLESLRAARRRVDERYAPRPALFVHARYLLGLYPRFPRLDWVFQAYHGGEAGVQRTLSKYLGSAWPGSSEAAIRGGLSFEELYLQSTPTQHREAFSYVYGRSDDHRYYWWKLVAAREAFARCRKDLALFRAEWESYLPGRAKDAMWYPTADRDALPNSPALQQARARKELLSVAGQPGLKVSTLAGHPPAALRPETLGALRLVHHLFARAGGQGPLVVSHATLPQNLMASLAKQDAIKNRKPAAPARPDVRPGGGPHADFNLHTTGLAADLARPKDPWQKKTLEFALGWLADRHILWWKDEKELGPRRYHVVPNPRYAEALAAIGRGGNLPRVGGP